MSFSSGSFSPASFSIATTPPTPPTPPLWTGSAGNVPGWGTKARKRLQAKYRQWIANLSRDVRRIFGVWIRPPPPPIVPPIEPQPEMPRPQPPQTVTILSEEPKTTEDAEKLQTLKDRWTFIASVPPPELRTEIIYVNQPGSSTPTQVTVQKGAIQLPKSQPLLRQQIVSSTQYQVGKGSHIESTIQPLKMPRPNNKSKAAATINKLMILLEIEQNLGKY